MDATGTIHFARFEESDRLQRLLEYMLDGCEHTGLEIILGAKITAVSAAACELRLNGFDMECVKQNNPSIYRLNNPAAAAERARLLLAKDAPAEAA